RGRRANGDPARGRRGEGRRFGREGYGGQGDRADRRNDPAPGETWVDGRRRLTGEDQALAGSSRCNSTWSSSSSEWNFAKFDGPRRMRPNAICRAATRMLLRSSSSAIAPSGTKIDAASL